MILALKTTVKSFFEYPPIVAQKKFKTRIKEMNKMGRGGGVGQPISSHRLFNLFFFVKASRLQPRPELTNLFSNVNYTLGAIFTTLQLLRNLQIGPIR